MSNPFSPIRQTTGYKEIQDAIVNRPLFSDVEKTTTTKDFSTEELQKQPSDQAVLAKLPTRIGGGSFITDQANLNEVIKSDRADFRIDNVDDSLRQGLDSRFYQIEHIMPLWLGGINDSSNIQMMFKQDHEKKTTVGSIARSLYYNKKIDLGEARNLVINWKDKNVDNVVTDEKGSVDINVAEAKFKEWQQPIKVGLKETLAGLASFLPFVGKGIAKDLDPGAELFREALQEGPKTVPGQAAQAFASGITFGWFPAPRREFEGAERTAAEVSKFVGGLAGTLAGFGGLGKVIFGEAALTKTATGLNKELFRIPGVLGPLRKSKVGIKLLEDIAVERNLIKAGMKKSYLGREVLMKMAGSAGLFAVGGQISRFEENTFRERFEQLFHDLTLGAVVGKAGTKLKGIAGVGATSFGLSYIMGDDLKDSFMNGAVMASLHGIGGRVHQAQFKKALNEQGVKRATEWRKDYLPEAKEKPTAIDLAIESSKIEKALTEQYKNDPEALYNKKKTLDIVNRMLYKETLSKPQRELADAQDMISLSRHVERPTNESNGVNTEMNDFIAHNPDVFGGTREKPLTVHPLPPEKVVEGSFQVTGYGKDISPEVKASIINLAKEVHTGNADKTVWVVKRSELKSTVEEVNAAMDPKAIKEGTQKNYNNPEKNVSVTKYLNGKFVKLGMTPRSERIDGLPNSINENIRRHNKLYPDIPFTEFDPNAVNKNTIFDNMGKVDAPVVRGEIVMITDGKGKENGGFGNKTESGEPAMHIKITKEGWEESVARNRDVKTQKQKVANEIISSLKDFKGENATSYDILKDLDVSITNNVMKVKILSTRNEAHTFIDKIAREVETGSKESLEKLVRQEIGFVNKEALNNIMKKGKEATIDDALFLANEHVLETLKHDADFMATWPSIKNDLLVKPKAELVAPPVKEKIVTPKKVKVVDKTTIEQEQKIDSSKSVEQELKQAKTGKEVSKIVEREMKEIKAKKVELDKIEKVTTPKEVKSEEILIDQGTKEGLKKPEAVKEQEIKEEQKQESEKTVDKKDEPDIEAFDYINEDAGIDAVSLSELSQLNLIKKPGDIGSLKEHRAFDTKDTGGSHKFTRSELDKDIIDLRNAGDLKRALKVENAKKFTTREMYTYKAKQLVKKHKGNTEAAFNEFRASANKYFQGVSGKVKHEYIKDNRVTRRAFNTWAEQLATREAIVTKDNKGNFDVAMEGVKDTEINSELTKKVEVISIDSHLPMKEIERALSSGSQGEGFELLGFKSNDTFVAIKAPKEKIIEYAKEYNKNPKEYKYAEDPKIMTAEEKYFRVLLKNDIGFPQTNTFKDFKKRVGLIDNRQLKNNMPGRKFKTMVLNDPKIRDIEAAHGQKIIHDNLIKGARKEDIDAIRELQWMDGGIFIKDPKLYKEILEKNYLDPSIPHLKPVGNYKWQSKNADGTTRNHMVLQKGMLFLATEGDIRFFREHLKRQGLTEKEINQRMNETDMFSFDSNVKVGIEDIPEVSKGVRMMDVPADTWRFENKEPGESSAKLPQSFISKLMDDIMVSAEQLATPPTGKAFQKSLKERLFGFSKNPQKKLSKAVEKMFGVGAKKFIDFRGKIRAETDMNKISKLFKEEYNYDFENNLYGHRIEAFKHGASKEFLQDIIEQSMNNIFQIEVLGYGHLKSNTVKVRPDTGYMKDGKLTFNNPNEIRMNAKMAKEFLADKSEHIMSLRNPITDPMAISKDKVIIDNTLRDGEVVASNHDLRLRKQGDTDGDSYAIFKIGEENGIDPVIADWFEANRVANGDIVLKEPAQKAEASGSFSKENMIDTWDGQALGAKAIGVTQALNRVLPTLKVANVRFEMRKSGPVMITGRELSSKSSVGEKSQTDIVFKVEYDREQIILGRDILQSALDSVKDPDRLRDMNWTTKFFIGEVLKPATEAAKGYKLNNKELDAINEFVNGKTQGEKDVTRPFQGFQEVHKLGNADNKIGETTKGSTPKLDVYLVNHVNRAKGFNDKLESSGAELSPSLSQFNVFEKPLERVIPLDPEGVGVLDRQSVSLVKEQHADIAESLKRPHVKEMARLMKSTRKGYKAAPDKTIQRNIVLNFFKENYAKYGTKDLQGISYLAATSNDGNVKHGFKDGVEYKDSDFVWRYNELIHLSSEIADTYYEGFRIKEEVNN